MENQKHPINLVIIGIVIILVIIILMIAFSGNSNNDVKHGELLSLIDGTSSGRQAEEICVLKVKQKDISTALTIQNQAFDNVINFIKKDGSKYNEIQYWAVADINGTESKVISFTLNKDLISKINNNEIKLSDMKENVSDFWIYPNI